MDTGQYQFTWQTKENEQKERSHNLNGDKIFYKH